MACGISFWVMIPTALGVGLLVFLVGVALLPFGFPVSPQEPGWSFRPVGGVRDSVLTPDREGSYPSGIESLPLRRARMHHPLSNRLAAIALPLVFAAPLVRADQPTIGDLRKTGTVHLATSCAPSVQEDFEHATALLHSFFYDEARRVFTQVATRDPKCAMAQWGIAMTEWHPLWTPPGPEEMKAGQEAIAKAKAIGGKTDLERGYIASLEAFYGAATVQGASGEVGLSCHGSTGGGDHPARAAAYEKAMAQLYAQHPDDVEVATFYALSLLGSASPTDKTLKNQTRATQILEPLFVKNPSHPGIVHYLIHGYDYPPVAEKGLPAAKAYADIAPWVPHALHMPAHIFTRLGMWNDVIASNLASADASRQYAARAHPDATSFEELHALDYMIYGYLQTGQDAQGQGRRGTGLEGAQDATRRSTSPRATRSARCPRATRSSGASGPKPRLSSTRPCPPG